jgi:hypothetical protein
MFFNLPLFPQTYLYVPKYTPFLSLYRLTTPTDNTWDVQTPNSQELEALCQMFPPMSSNAAENVMGQTGNMYLPHGYDDFNGLMDMYMPSFNGVLLDAENSGRHEAAG